MAKMDRSNFSSEELAANLVVSALERRIYSGQLKSGSVLPAERELSEEFRVSRTVAREAVKILGGKGLIEMRPRHRPVVLRPGYEMAVGAMGNLVGHLIEQAKGVENLFQLRIFVEAGLARMAAADANKDDISNLRAALENNRQCIDNSEAFYDTDVSFHAVLYQVPRNPIYPALHRSFSDWLKGHWLQMPRSPQTNRLIYQAHEEILTGILNRNPDQAEDALRRHLEYAWTQVCHTFEELKSPRPSGNGAGGE